MTTDAKKLSSHVFEMNCKLIFCLWWLSEEFVKWGQGYPCSLKASIKNLANLAGQ